MEVVLRLIYDNRLFHLYFWTDGEGARLAGGWINEAGRLIYTTPAMASTMRSTTTTLEQFLPNKRIFT